MVMEESDVVVVGGGTAGCVLVNRLSEDPTATVMLLEAGTADTPPAVSNPGSWLQLAGTEVDWAFSTTPQKQTEGAVHPVPGKGPRGIEQINGMMHIRGHALSYDAFTSVTLSLDACCPAKTGVPTKWKSGVTASLHALVRS
jgi:choline dehydrogenase